MVVLTSYYLLPHRRKWVHLFTAATLSFVLQCVGGACIDDNLSGVEECVPRAPPMGTAAQRRRAPQCHTGWVSVLVRCDRLWGVVLVTLGSATMVRHHRRPHPAPPAPASSSSSSPAPALLPPPAAPAR